MKKEQIIEMLLQGKSIDEVLSTLNEKDKAIYEMLRQHKTYKEIENTLSVFPSQIAFIKKYLIKKQGSISITEQPVNTKTEKQDSVITDKPISTTEIQDSNTTKPITINKNQDSNTITKPVIAAENPDNNTTKSVITNENPDSNTIKKPVIAMENPDNNTTKSVITNENPDSNTIKKPVIAMENPDSNTTKPVITDENPDSDTTKSVITNENPDSNTKEQTEMQNSNEEIKRYGIIGRMRRRRRGRKLKEQPNTLVPKTELELDKELKNKNEPTQEPEVSPYRPNSFHDRRWKRMRNGLNNKIG